MSPSTHDVISDSPSNILKFLVEAAAMELSKRNEGTDYQAKTQGIEKQVHGYAIRAMSEEELLTWIFTYHDDPAKVPNYIAIRTAGKRFAEDIMRNVKPCADRTEALRTVRLAVLWANAALALDGVSF